MLHIVTCINVDVFLLCLVFKEQFSHSPHQRQLHIITCFLEQLFIFKIVNQRRLLILTQLNKSTYFQIYFYNFFNHYHLYYSYSKHLFIIFIWIHKTTYEDYRNGYLFSQPSPTRNLFLRACNDKAVHVQQLYELLTKRNDYGGKPFVVNIEEATTENNNYRTAL